MKNKCFLQFSDAVVRVTRRELDRKKTCATSPKVLFHNKHKKKTKKPSYRWGTARRGRASWNLV